MILPGFHARLSEWSRWADPRSGIVTLTLNLARSGPLPPETRQFFKHGALKTMRKAGSTRDGIAALRSLADRIDEFVSRQLRPETEGLFLTAGPELWEAVELPLPLRNFVWVGTSPYLAPLLELEERAPRSLVVVADRGAVSISEFYLGFLEPLEELSLPSRETDPQRRVNLKETPLRASGARVARRSDSTNQKRRRHDDERVEAVFRRAARKVIQASKHIRPETVFLCGEKRSLRPLFALLSRDFAQRIEYLGPAPGAPHRIMPAVIHALEKRIRAKREGEIRNLLALRSQGHLVSLGPSSALGRLHDGTGLRYYLDPYDPLPGVACANCGARFVDLRLSCGFCGVSVRPVSLTQEFMNAKVAHPEMGVTFVTKQARWLDDLGGLAAIRKPLKAG
jgi:hypothetical protein